MREDRLTLRIVEPDGFFRICTFTKPAEIIVGRAEDCDIRLPKDGMHSQISRHHCAFEIDPPTIRVRDLDSRNGTFVNGENIGQRSSYLENDNPDAPEAPSKELKDGDEVRLGLTRICIGIEKPSRMRELARFAMSFVEAGR